MLVNIFTFDRIIALIEVLVSIIGLAFVIVGWVLPYRQSIKLDQSSRAAQLKQTQRELKIQRIDDQLSKYYGPILALLKEQSIIWDRICDQIGRDGVFKEGERERLADLEPDTQKIWMHFVDKYKIPLQREIVNIMRENAHLAETDISRNAPYRFLAYVVGWELLDRQKRDGVPNYYEYHGSTNYPNEFNEYIGTTFDKLTQEREALLREMAEDNPNRKRKDKCPSPQRN